MHLQAKRKCADHSLSISENCSTGLAFCDLFLQCNIYQTSSGVSDAALTSNLIKMEKIQGA